VDSLWAITIAVLLLKEPEAPVESKRDNTGCSLIENKDREETISQSLFLAFFITQG